MPSGSGWDTWRNRGTQAPPPPPPPPSSSGSSGPWRGDRWGGGSSGGSSGVGGGPYGGGTQAGDNWDEATGGGSGGSGGSGGMGTTTSTPGARLPSSGAGTGRLPGNTGGTPPPAGRIPPEEQWGGPPVADAEAIDFFAMAQALYPWLPEVLLRAFADAWATYGDPAVAFGVMRQHPQYDQYFAGNRRDDGTFRYTEQEYMAVRDGMGQLLADYGQNAGAYNEHITRAITGDVSVQEFRDRLDLLWTQVAQQIPQIRAAYVEEFGLNPSDPDATDANIFASFLNPGASLQELRVRVTNSQIVGQGAAYGFDRGFARANELARAGLTGEESRNLYQQAAVQVPTLSGFAARYYDPDDEFDIDDFEDAATGLDPFEQERAQRLIRFERSAFTGAGQVSRDQTGALTGLQQQ